MRLPHLRLLLALVALYVVGGYVWIWYAAQTVQEARRQTARYHMEAERMTLRASDCAQVVAEEEGRIAALRFEETQLVEHAEVALKKVHEEEKFCMWQSRKAVEAAQSTENDVRRLTAKLYEGEGVVKAMLLEGLATLLRLPEKSLASMDMSVGSLRNHLVNELAGRLAAPRESIRALPDEALLKQVNALTGT